MARYSNGFITLHRKMLDWVWYTDRNTLAVFIHLLLTANWQDGNFGGMVIPKGSCVIGRQTIAKELKMSEQSVRTALKHLKSTNEITIKSTNKSTKGVSLVTIVNWAKYQDGHGNLTKETTKETTKELTTIEQYKQNKQYKEKENKEKILVPDDLPQTVRTALTEWLEYKKERKQKYTETGWKKLMTQIRNASEKCGTDRVVESINNSMANNYQGIFFDRVKRGGKSINLDYPHFDYEQRKIKNEDFEHLFLNLDEDPTEGT